MCAPIHIHSSLFSHINYHERLIFVMNEEEIQAYQTNLIHRIQGILFIVLLRMQKHSNRCLIENVEFFSHSKCRRFELKKQMKRTAGMIRVTMSVCVFYIPSALLLVVFFVLFLVFIWLCLGAEVTLVSSHLISSHRFLFLCLFSDSMNHIIVRNRENRNW